MESAKLKVPKCQFDTLKCILDKLEMLELIIKNPTVKQAELAVETGKF